jgi:hypothetical protein
MNARQHIARSLDKLYGAVGSVVADELEDAVREIDAAIMNLDEARAKDADVELAIKDVTAARAEVQALASMRIDHRFEFRADSIAILIDAIETAKVAEADASTSYRSPSLGWATA